MPLKILEHCCFRKYLNNWYADRRDEDCWSLINYGDHTLTDLLEWCINMCWSKEGCTVTIAMPVLTVTTLEWLAKHKGIATLNIITREPIDTTKLSIVNCKMVNVVVPDLHTQLVTIRSNQLPLPFDSSQNGGDGGSFVLQNSLLQSVCPGKYITTIGITQRYYDGIQPLLNSWLRLYSKKN